MIMTAMGAEPEMFTNWGLIYQQMKELISNPFMLASVVLAVTGVLFDPTTRGLSDSSQALTYKEPRR